jgi:hypothetical protein
VSDDLVAHADGVVCCAPARAQRVDVRSADAAMRDFNVDVDGVEGFRCEGCPGHVALGGGFVVAEPAGELGWGRHGRARYSVRLGNDRLMLWREEHWLELRVEATFCDSDVMTEMRRLHGVGGQVHPRHLGASSCLPRNLLKRPTHLWAMGLV